ncbi:MAG: TetR/AcrR family transcriptional regulator [Actinobacteria bacterium]|nr:TetR/AcrR family transcriptional regulator [Actinomycetota bacterium]
MARRENPLKGEREKQIKQAALRLFSRRGFHHTTIADIAEEAGLGKGTIYWYWRSKEELAFALVEDMLDAFLALIREEQGREGPFHEKMRRLVDAAADLYAQEKEHCRLLWKFRADRHYIFNQEYVRAVTSYYQEMRTHLSAMVRRALEDGEIAGIDPDRAALIILGITEGLELEWLENEDFDLRESLHVVLENLFEGLRPGDRRGSG